MKNISKISFFATIIGIACLVVVSQYIQPEKISIGSINDASVGKIVSVNGIIGNTSLTNKMFFSLSDTTGTVDVLIFENVLKSSTALKDGFVVTVAGKIFLYKNKYEIIAESVKII